MTPTTADKIAQAQHIFGIDAELSGKLSNYINTKNYFAYCNEFSDEARIRGLEISPEEVRQHFGFNKENPSVKSQVKDTVKDEVKSTAKDEATGMAEDEIGNQLGVDLGGVGDAAGGILDTIKGWFGGKKQK